MAVRGNIVGIDSPEALERALANDGPNLIEAIVPPLGL